MKQDNVFSIFRFDKFFLIFILAVLFLLIFDLYITQGLNIELTAQQDFFCTLFIFYGSILFWLKMMVKKTGIMMEKIVGTCSIKNTGVIIIFGIFIAIFSAGILDIFLQLSSKYISYLTEQIKVILGRDTLQDDIVFFTLNRLIITFIAPIVEEVFFRGILLHKWGIKFGIKKAIIFSSLIFAVFHVNIIGGFVFSVLASLLYLKSGKLLVPVILHMTSNFLNTVALYLEKININLSDILLLKFLPSIYSILYIFFLFIIVSYVIYKHRVYADNNLPYYSC